MTLTARPSGRWYVPAAIVGLTSLVILLVLNPWLILDPSTPAGGDMGAHVYGPAYLRDVLLPDGRVSGWSNDWFAGFPLFYFYFPLPSLVIVFLDLFVPYGVAFKIATVLGLIATPPSVYFLTRSLRFGRVVASISAAGTAAFVFMESYSIYGANIASTLAGEFSYSWSFALGFLYLGLLIRVIEGERHLIPRTVVVFALAALSHLLTIIPLLLATLVLFVRRGAWKPTFTVWIWAGLLTGFWSIPLVFRLPLSTDMAWTPLSRWEEIFPLELWLLIPLAVVGLVWAARRTGYIAAIAALMLIPLIYYPLPNLVPDLFPELVENGRWKLYNGRLLPYWYFGVVYFGSLGVGAFVSGWLRRLPERSSMWWATAVIAAITATAAVQISSNGDLPGWVTAAVIVLGGGLMAATFAWRAPVTTAHLVAGTASAVLALGALAGVTFVDGWARWNYSGYEGKDTFEEYQGFMEQVDALPPGRYQWEFNSELNQYGTTMSLMLIPYWVGQGHQSMEGLFFESSLTVPFHFLNQSEMSRSPSQPVPGLDYHPFDFERGIPHLQLYGIDYYVSFTDEARQKARGDDRLQEVATSGPFVFFEVEGSQLVDVATFQPSVLDLDAAGEPFGEVALEWYASMDTLDRWLVADGPEDWPVVTSADGVADAEPRGGSGEVSNIEIGDDYLTFDTTAVGVPHMVKISYFPNWEATGAEGPYRAAPSLMVVVPTEEHVELHFGRDPIEYAGTGASVLALGALVVVTWRSRREPEGRG